MKEEPTPPAVCEPGPCALDVNECAAIAAAEYHYWKEAPGDIGMSGVGAAVNILCAINGFRAPWHPKPLPTYTIPGTHCPPPDNENAQELLRELRKVGRALLDDATGAGRTSVVTTSYLDELQALLRPLNSNSPGPDMADMGQPDKLP